MENMDSINIVRKFYNSSVQYEWERLLRHPIEFAITKAYIGKYAFPGCKLLDIGGGPGRYSLHFAEKGCDVTLFDLSEENVSFAQSKAREQNLTIRAIPGDARDVGRVVQGSFDVILLMGPMYHLLEEADRVQAVNGALKLLKPGGVLFVAFISLYAGFSYYMKNGPQLVFEAGEHDYIQCYLENRTYCGDAFTKACFISPKDILPFMGQFGLEKLHLFGQEGITSPSENNIMACGQEVIDRWTEIALATCEREEFLSYSEHLMYAGRKTAEC